MKDMGIHIARVCCAVPSTFVITEKEREEMECMNVKFWYHDCFPTDDLWDKVPEGYTFGGLFHLLDRRKYSYQLFADDSIVRERILNGLSIAMNVPYSEVYEQWMMCKNVDSRIFGDVEGNRKALEKVYEIMSNQD